MDTDAHHSTADTAPAMDVHGAAAEMDRLFVPYTDDAVDYGSIDEDDMPEQMDRLLSRGRSGTVHYGSESSDSYVGAEDTASLQQIPAAGKLEPLSVISYDEDGYHMCTIDSEYKKETEALLKLNEEQSIEPEEEQHPTIWQWLCSLVAGIWHMLFGGNSTKTE
jgi:hypothetical protein